MGCFGIPHAGNRVANFGCICVCLPVQPDSGECYGPALAVVVAFFGDAW